MTAREKFRREIELDGDGIVRSNVLITYPVWKEYGEKLNWLEGYSEHVSVGISRTPGRQAYSEVDDIWGCHWIYPLEALDGQCIGHPIDSWDKLATYRPPDPDAFQDWNAVKERFRKARENGNPTSGGTDHGFIFLRLTYLRGFENFMMDVAERRPELDELIGIVEGYWMGVVGRWVEAGADLVQFGDDLGLQTRLPISPESWRRVIKPSYKRIFQHCRSNGTHVALHSDGYIVDIIPDLIECGVSIINPQDYVNGIDNIKRLAKGKVFIRLDIDRQKTTVFGSPREVRSHIQTCVGELGSPNGGLSFVWGVYPPTPLENIEAAVKAMAEFATYWA